MEFEYVSYRRSNSKVIKTSDGMVYSNSSKGRPGQPNICYVPCVLKECPGTRKIKTDTAEFDPTRLHNHLPNKYDLLTKQLEVRLCKTASTSQHMTLKQIFNKETRSQHMTLKQIFNKETRSQHMTLKQIFNKETRIDGNGAAGPKASKNSRILWSQLKGRS
jgi:hypothetical protein